MRTFTDVRAKGFKRTAVAVDIDGGEDGEIKREALDAWNHLKMRKEIDKEVAMVRAEVKANRFRWTSDAVQGLMTPYAKSKYDEVIANTHEDNWCEAMEKVWKESAGSDVEARSSGSSSDDDESEDESSTDGGDEEETEVDARDTCVDADSSPPKKQKCADLSPSQASYVDEAKEKNHILSDIKKQIIDSSLMGLLPAVERESHVEKRRQLRRMSEDSAVAEALASWQRTE